MKPNTVMTRARARSRSRMHREPFFGKSHIVLAAALLASLAASAPAQAQGSGEPHHIIVPVRTRVIVGDGMGSCNQYSVEVNGVKYACPDGSLSGFNIVAFYRVPGTDDNGMETLKLYKHAAIHTDGNMDKVKDCLDELLNDPEKDLLVIVSTFGQGGWRYEVNCRRVGKVRSHHRVPWHRLS